MRRSTTPPGEFRSHGSASHSSAVAACRRSVRARRSAPPAVPLEASLTATRCWLVFTAVSRQIWRMRWEAQRVCSIRQRCPVQTSHFPHSAQ